MQDFVYIPSSFKECKSCKFFSYEKSYTTHYYFTERYGNGFICKISDWWITKDGVIPGVIVCCYFELSFEAKMKKIIDEEEKK